jgi:hypothetical protein
MAAAAWRGTLIFVADTARAKPYPCSEETTNGHECTLISVFGRALKGEKYSLFVSLRLSLGGYP